MAEITAHCQGGQTRHSRKQDKTRHLGNPVCLAKVFSGQRDPIDDNTKPQGCHGQVMAFQLQYRHTEDQRNNRCHQDGKDTGCPWRDGQQLLAIQVLAGHQYPQRTKKLDDRACLQGNQIMGGQGGRQITADGKKTGMSDGNLAGIPHEDGQADNHQTIVGRHGQLGQVIGCLRGLGKQLNCDNQHGKKSDGKAF